MSINSHYQPSLNRINTVVGPTNYSYQKQPIILRSSINKPPPSFPQYQSFGSNIKINNVNQNHVVNNSSNSRTIN